MQQGENSIFPMNEALEMIIMFDAAGKISYVNETARQKLEYDDDLCGKQIGDVFPNVFSVPDINFDDNVEKGLQKESQKGLQNFVAYRKNKTCFRQRAKLLKQIPNRDCTYVCLMTFWKESF